MNTTTQDLTTMTPRAFDEALAVIHTAHSKNLSRLAYAQDIAHRAAGDRKTGYGRDAYWSMTNTEMEEKLTDRANADGPRSYAARNALRDLQADQELVKGTQDQIGAFDAVFRQRGGWSRFFLVSSNNGHIHSSMHCSTCRPTTQFGWLPEVSGKTEEEAVAAHGAMLCTVCFPSAPLDWTNHWDREEERKRAESCDGSGTYDWVPGTTRFGYAAGNGGKCSVCQGYAAATAGGKIRKHKPSA